MKKKKKKKKLMRRAGLKINPYARNDRRYRMTVRPPSGGTGGTPPIGGGEEE